LQKKQLNTGGIANANGTGTYGSKKGRPMKKKPTAMKKKYKGFSKLPEGVQRKINKKLAKKV